MTIDFQCYNNLVLTYQGDVTPMPPVVPPATGIKMTSRDQGKVTKTSRNMNIEKFHMVSSFQYYSSALLNVYGTIGNILSSTFRKSQQSTSHVIITFNGDLT